ERQHRGRPVGGEVAGGQADRHRQDGGGPGQGAAGSGGRGRHARSSSARRRGGPPPRASPRAGGAPPPRPPAGRPPAAWDWEGATAGTAVVLCVLHNRLTSAVCDRRPAPPSVLRYGTGGRPGTEAPAAQRSRASASSPRPVTPSLA